MAKVWKHQHSPLLRYLSAFSQNTFLLRKWLSFNPSTRIEVTSIPLHKTWQMNLLWLMDPPGTRAEMPCIPLHKFGRWTYFGWTQWQRFESSSTHHFWDTSTAFSQNTSLLRKWLSFIPSTRIEMTCIPLHKTWQMNLLWLMDPPGTRAEMPCIPLHKFGRWTYFGWTQWQRFESSSTHHFWDTPQHFLKTHLCIESGFLLCLELQKSLLVSFRGAEHNGKGLKALAFTTSEIPVSIFSKHIFA